MAIDNTDGTLIMSDSLVGMVPELEDVEKSPRHEFSDLYLILGLHDDDQADPLGGRSVRFSLEEENRIKVDMRLGIDEAYEFIKKFKTTRLSCRLLYLCFGDDEICFDGPFNIACPRIFDADRQNKMCTLGLDLIKA